MVAAILPWVEQVTLGFALTAQGRHAPSILLAVVAAVSAGIAGTVLLRRKPAAGVAILLIGLAVAQLGAAIWFDVTTVNEIRETHPHLVLMSTIGTGVYPAGLGAVSTLAGAILAWTRRRIQ
jgi:hypothetical protein